MARMRRLCRASLSILGLLTASALAKCPSSSDDPTVLRVAGRDAARQQKYQEAGACLEASIQADPRSGESWADLAMARIDAGDEEGAHEALVQAVDPSNEAPQAGQLYLLGLGLMKRSMLPDAAVAFEYSAYAQPDDARSWLNLGAVQQSLGMLEDAIASYEHTVGVQPSHSAYFNLATSQVSSRCMGAACTFVNIARVSHASLWPCRRTMVHGPQSPSCVVPSASAREAR